MNQKVIERQKVMVRGFLKTLRDDEDDRKSSDTIQAVSREQSVPVKTLRRFRDGNDSALPTMVVGTWAKMLGTDGGIAGYGSLSPIESVAWYTRVIEKSYARNDKFRMYETIDDTRPEAASALDAWADIVVTGGIGDTRRADFEPELESTAGTRLRAAMKEVSDVVNRRLLPTDQKLMLVRDMAKYGVQYEQPGIEMVDGRYELTSLVNMPVKTMWKVVGDDGRVDPNKAFCQQLDGQPEPVAEWPAWKMVEFSNSKSRGDMYGRSIFESCLRSYIQIEAMEAAMLIRRLERAPLRMKHVIDVGHLQTDTEIADAREKYRQSHRKLKTIDGNRNLASQRINMPADEDYVVAKRDKDSPADIIPLEGDANIGEIEDYMTFFNKWLSGLGPPKAHLGYESDTMRSVVTDLHIVFARKGRRVQMQFIRGLTHLFWLAMILKGIDPRKVNFQIIPPALGTRDELVRAQVIQTYSTVVSNLAKSFSQTGKQPSIRWFLTYIMGLDQETVEAMELEPILVPAQAGPGSGGQNKGQDKTESADELDPATTAEMVAASMANDEVASKVGHTRFLLGERAIGLKRPDLMGIEIPRIENPFGDRFGDVVRALRPVGKRELTVIRD